MRQRREFSDEFRLGAVKLAESRTTPIAQVCRDLDICESVLRRWMAKYGTRPDGTRVTPEEHAELARLRKENALLKMERDILKKAMGICVRELP